QVERTPNATTDAETVRAFDAVMDAYNATMDEAYTLMMYIHSFVATDSRNALAQAQLSALQIHLATLSKLGTRLVAWLGSLDTTALVAQSETARAHEYALRRAKIEAAHQMTPVEEELAAELNLSGGSAWARLHGNVSSQIMVNVELDGETKALPMSAARNLASDARRDVRARAHHAELEAWEKHAVPLAAALNSIKGQLNTLSARRHWESALDEAIFDAAIDRATLDAMLGAAREAFPAFRRYLRAKARALGLERLAFYDIFAPLGADTRVWSYDDARAFILTHFGSYSERMKGLAQRAFDEHWIDAEPRAGKRDGAFCMRVRAAESRVLTNFKPAFGGMSTLAHELGHAYHNLTLAPRTAVQRSTPMTLAETASIFCETIVKQAALREANAQEQLAILENSLQGACQVVVDITSRFLFEQRVFEGRRAREWSVQELCELMTDAQKETYGDGLDPHALHPYMWAAKPHYYRDSMAFYNFPYMFGLLFGLGLYAQYQANPAEFKKSYDDLLSSTGLADAATLAARFGFD
ncbi:M3 family oligoendopeptidase, partial [Anaerolineae bacterium CFX7]|nr:M3 family oligoendopeptidase [Anaerolineae bacterium CFX7]